MRKLAHHTKQSHAAAGDAAALVLSLNAAAFAAADDCPDRLLDFQVFFTFETSDFALNAAVYPAVC